MINIQVEVGKNDRCALKIWDLWGCRNWPFWIRKPIHFHPIPLHPVMPLLLSTLQDLVGPLSPIFHIPDHQKAHSGTFRAKYVPTVLCFPWILERFMGEYLDFETASFAALANLLHFPSSSHTSWVLRSSFPSLSSGSSCLFHSSSSSPEGLPLKRSPNYIC